MDYDIQTLETLLNSLTAATYIIDANGHTLFANNATLKMYRCSRDVFEREYSDIYAMDRNGIFSENLYPKVLAQKKRICCRHRIYDVNREANLYFTWNSPVFDSQGNVKFVVGQTYLQEDVAYFDQAAHSGFCNYTEIQLVSNDTDSPLVCASVAMKNLLNSMTRMANVDVPILIYGETGTGKEILANYIHSSGKRKEHSMICVNCAAIAGSLFESEMFGYSRGAFTGSDPGGKKGLFESADHSTLFLDEVDSLPLEQQGKLLRALETKTIVRVGESKPINVDFRLLVATNKNLSELIANGKFREDLYYRLSVVPAHIPPLREREGDVRALTDHFLSHYLKKYDIKKKFSEAVYQQLESYSWPGNVRELKNMIERVLLMSDPSVYEIETIALPSGDGTLDFFDHYDKRSFNKTIKIAPQVSEDSLGDQLSSFEKEILVAALKKYRTSSEAASALGISEPTMSRKMAKYHLSKVELIKFAFQ